MQGRHYETVSKWVKEIGLLLFAALVVERLVSGVVFSEPAVIGGLFISFLIYAFAVWLLLKS